MSEWHLMGGFKEVKRAFKYLREKMLEARAVSPKALKEKDGWLLEKIPEAH